jgi:hypothetical protein
MQHSTPPSPTAAPFQNATSSRHRSGVSEPTESHLGLIKAHIVFSLSNRRISGSVRNTLTIAALSSLRCSSVSLSNSSGVNGTGAKSAMSWTSSRLLIGWIVS